MIDWIIKTLQNKYFVLTTKIIAAFVIVISIYSFFKSDNANLKYEILLNEQIIDVREQIDNLNVFYDSISVIQDNFQISSLILRVINDGSKSLTTDLYDSNFLPGIDFQRSKILSYDITRASNNYITNALKIEKIDSNKVKFNPIIIDDGQYFDLKFLLLHADSISIFPNSTGKIASVNEIKVFEKFTENDSDSFLLTTFKGKFLVQVLRVFAYTILFFMLIILILAFISSPSEKYYMKKRKRLVDEFKTIDKRYSIEKYQTLYQRFIDNHEVDYLKNLVRNINLFRVISESQDKHTLLNIFGTIDKDNKDLNFFPSLFDKSKSKQEQIRYLFNSELRQIGALYLDKGHTKILFDEEFIQVLNELYFFIDKKY